MHRSLHAVLCAVLTPCCPAQDDGPTPLVRETAPLITPEMVLRDVEKLCTFGTRHTLSDRASADKGLLAAARWTREEFAKVLGDERAIIETFSVPPSTRLPAGAADIPNVVAVKAGFTDAGVRRAIYVVGHLDSRNGDALDASGPAPGANDDASGVAVTLACARALKGVPLDSTVIFLATGAEEQGLLGAKFHAEQLAAGRAYDEVWVLSNDIVGDPSPRFFTGDAGDAALPRESSGIVRVFSESIPRNPTAETLARIRAEGAESDSPSRQLARFVRYVAEREAMPMIPMLVFRQDRFLRGGDHSAFNDAGFPAVRFTVPAEDYTRQHVNVTGTDSKPYGDVASFVDGVYLARVARLNLATLMHLAQAPSLPGRARVLTKELTTGTTILWDAPPESDIAGFEVVWRLTTAPDWTSVKDVKLARSCELPLSKDNFFFGVRAYDTDGYRSPVAFAWAAKE